MVEPTIRSPSNQGGAGDGAAFEAPRLPLWLLSTCGFLISSLGALCGIGGGLFATPLTHFGFHFPLRRAVPISLAVVATGTISGTVSETLRADGAVQWSLVMVLVASALVGNQIGFRLMDRISVSTLKTIFVVLLIGIGAKIMLSAGHAATVGEAGLDLGDHLSVIGLGVIAGILVPLLGIGGGMVLVPGLLFLVPGIGYLGVRATSVAVAAFISSRSLWRYSRRGKVDWHTARWLALGSLFGAWGGVALVHVPGVAPVAQITMGIVLWISAARFAFDVWKARSQG